MANIHDFSRDLLDLYAKTGIRELEDNYLTVTAEANGQITNPEILNWLSMRPKVQLSDPSVLDALMALKDINLSDLQQGINYWLVKSSPFGSEKGGVNHSSYIGYFIVFSKVFKNPNVSVILRPFEQALTVFSNPMVRSERFVKELQLPDEFNVFHDLSVLQSSFIKNKEILDNGDSRGGRIREEMRKKPTKQKQKEELYAYLYDRFTEDISASAAKSGYSEFADKIRNEDFLGKTRYIQDYLNKSGLSGDIFVDQLNSDYEYLTDDLISNFMKSLNRYLGSEKNNHDAYRDIKEEVMRINGHINRKTIEEIKKQRQEKKNLRPDAENQIDSSLEMPLPNEAWLDGVVIAMISKILADLHSKFLI